MLEIQDIHVFYGDLQALYGVSLEVQEGEVVALVGANGAGKTTTLRTISGLLRPRSGAIWFDKQPVHRLPPHQIVELGISHVPESRQLFPLMTVEENLLLGGHIRRVRSDRQRMLHEEIYPLFPRLQERRQQLAGTLSGGEQQMVAIARGLMSRPRLLILDEPSLGLAPVVVQEMFNVVRRIREQGVTVLIVEQNVTQTLQLADRAYVMENGQVVLSGDSKSLVNDEHMKKAYLGM
ncbi:MAG: ABC transporter ATP-binding protein [Alicyclobacillus sp.]|nr:ABC transporter ATP-binding protein [Alicyclobacillus sp.]